MKIGIAAPLSIAAVNGGVRTQVLQTAKYLSQLDVEVEFIHFDQTQFDYDLVHVFSASPETIGIAKLVKDKGIKLAVSPVFFSNRSASTIAASLTIEKTISGVGSGIRSDFGIKSQICKWADVVLPNTKAERDLVRDGLKVDARKIKVMPNGVESRFASATPDLFNKTYGIQNFILFVGQAGAERKNVLQLLKVAEFIDEHIVIIGSFYDNPYSNKCLEIAESLNNVTLIESLEHASPLLESAYAASSVFCLPSLYETPGIAAMEAALAGSQIVITERGGTEEYFNDMATYINPEDATGLEQALKNSLNKDAPQDLKDHILKNFIWEAVAEKTLAVYKSLS